MEFSNQWTGNNDGDSKLTDESGITASVSLNRYVNVSTRISLPSRNDPTDDDSTHVGESKGPAVDS